MDYIDYGLLGFERQIIAERFADGATGDLAEFCHELSVRGLLAGYEVAERFYEVGTPDSLRELEQFVESAQGGSRG
jgi:NDP-sugar pyrophosphorylase family protein